jgi:hypothetical protein
VCSGLLDGGTELAQSGGHCPDQDERLAQVNQIRFDGGKQQGADYRNK